MRLALAGDEFGAAQVDHLGGDGDGDLLGVLGLDGNADRKVQLVDLVLRKTFLLQAGTHKGRLAARAKATQIGGLLINLYANRHAVHSAKLSISPIIQKAYGILISYTS